MAYGNTLTTEDLMKGFFDDLKSGDTFEFDRSKLNDDNDQKKSESGTATGTSSSSSRMTDWGSVAESNTQSFGNGDTQVSVTTLEFSNDENDRTSSHISMSVETAGGDNDGWSMSVFTDEDGNVTSTVYTVWSTDANGVKTKTTFKLDANGNIVSTKTEQYDSDGNLIGEGTGEDPCIPWEDVFGRDPMALTDVDLSDADDLALVLNIYDELSAEFM